MGIELRRLTVPAIKSPKTATIFRREVNNKILNVSLRHSPLSQVRGFQNYCMKIGKGVWT